MLKTWTNYFFKEYNLLRVTINCGRRDKIFCRNIVFPTDMNTSELLKLLTKTIPKSVIVSFTKEKIISLVDESNQEQIERAGLIDKYWLDTLVYVIEFEDILLLVVCEYDMNKDELRRWVESNISVKGDLFIEEVSECWFLRKKQH
ncbi:hypothetical protein ACFJYZ_08320 [Enterococcus faecalis]